MMIRWLLACSLVVCCSLAVGCSGSDAETGAEPKPVNDKTEASKDAKKHFDAVGQSLTNAREAIKKARESITKVPTVSSAKTPAKQTTNTKGRPAATPSPSPLKDAQHPEQSKDAIVEAITALERVESPLGSLENALAAQPD